MARDSARMPAVFFGHGSPMNALEQNRYTEIWRHVGASVSKPKAILCVSAHWMTRGTAVTAMDRPRTIHDFSGFPQELFKVQYPAPGSPALATRVRELLAPVEVQMDRSWGLDHGTWSVLAQVYPNADIPVVQLSMDATQPPDYHYRLGARLAPLRDEGVFIMGSGNLVHNLGRIQWADDAVPYGWATRFNEKIHKHLTAREHRPLIDYTSHGDDARQSVPTPEHYLPFLYVLGMQRKDEVLVTLVDGIEHGSIGMLTISAGLQECSGPKLSSPND